MQWFKDFLISCVVVLSFVISWLISVQIGNFFWTFHDGYEWYAVVLAIIITIIGCIIVKFAPENYRIIGAGIALGAIIGLIFSLSRAIILLFEDTNGFWPCFGVWLIFTLMMAYAIGGVTYGVRSIINSVTRFDFTMTLVSFALFISCFYTAVFIFITSVQISPLIAIGLILGLTGGAAGYSAPTVNSDDYIVSDGHGGYHFVTGPNGAGHLIGTDGNTLRKRPDGTYEQINE